MSKSDSPTESIRRLVELVVEHNLAELDVENDGVHINIKGLVQPPQPGALSAHPLVTVVPAAVQPAARPQLPVDVKPARTDVVALESPMVGTFFRAASPNDPPFVNVGDTVRVGQTIGFIEAMKVYSEVPAEAGGRIVEIVADNNKLVHHGDPLMYVEVL